MPKWLIKMTLCAAMAMCAVGQPLRARAQNSSAAPSATATLGTVQIRVRQTNDAPVADAEISIKGNRVERVVRSDNNGIAVAQGYAPGYVEIRVRRVGFKQEQFLARVGAGQNSFTITVDGASVVLDEMRIVGNRPVLGRYEDFEMRRIRGEASAVITADEIEKRRPIRLSQMLRSVPGVSIAEGALGGTVAISKRMKNPSGFAMRDCIMRVMIDGVVQPQGADLDLVVPQQTYGVEIFNGPAAIPLKLQGMRSDQWCGLIAIWTKAD